MTYSIYTLNNLIFVLPCKYHLFCITAFSNSFTVYFNIHSSLLKVLLSNRLSFTYLWTSHKQLQYQFAEITGSTKQVYWLYLHGSLKKGKRRMKPEKTKWKTKREMVKWTSKNTILIILYQVKFEKLFQLCLKVLRSAISFIISG